MFFSRTTNLKKSMTNNVCLLLSVIRLLESFDNYFNYQGNLKNFIFLARPYSAIRRIPRLEKILIQQPQVYFLQKEHCALSPKKYGLYGEVDMFLLLTIAVLFSLSHALPPEEGLSENLHSSTWLCLSVWKISNEREIMNYASSIFQ